MDDPTPNVEAPSKPPRRFRRTRIAVSVFFGVLTVALCVLWVRGCYRWDELRGRTYDGRAFQLYSTQGRVVWYEWNMSDSQYFPLGVESVSLDEHRKQLWSSQYEKLGFYVIRQSQFAQVTVPLYFLASTTGMIAMIPWLPHRFSLRTMHIATTLVAVVLGLAVWAMR